MPDSVIPRLIRAAAALALLLPLPSLSGHAASPSAEEIAPSPVASLERAVREAEAALRDDEPQIAESRFRTALLEGWLLLGSLAIEDGRLSHAKTAFERAAETSVESTRPLTSLALVELELGETASALARLRSIVLNIPTDLGARRLLARALTASDRHDEAVQELEQLHAVAPDHLENAFLLASAYLRQGRPEAADPLIAQLVEERPIPQTWVLIGRVERDAGGYDRARAALERALELDPTTRRAHYYLGTIDLLDRGRGRLDEAMAHFEAELTVAPEDPMASLYLGIGLVENRRHEEAIPHLENASRLAVARRDAFQFLGRSYLALGEVESAVVALRRALELAEADVVRVPERAEGELHQSRMSSIHYQLGLALRRSGDEQEARVHFEASKQYSALVAESSRELLSRYLESETRTMDSSSRSLLERSPLAALSTDSRRKLAEEVTTTLARTYLNLGVLRIRAEQHARAAELFQSAADLDPDLPQVQYSLGVARFNAGQFERATAPLAAALADRANDAALRRMLALAWLNAEGYERAVELLRDDPGRAGDGSLQYAYGLALVRSGRADEAEAIFARLLAENDDWPELNVLVGQAHAHQDDYDSAVRFLSRAIELDPRVAEAHATLGDIYLRQGKLEEAEAALRAELATHPEDARALYTLAVVLDLSQKTGEALRVLDTLISRDPATADARYLRGKIYVTQGAIDRALVELEAAVELAPADANIHYQLGRALQAAGRTDEANAAFETFRRLKDERRTGEIPG